MKYNSNLQFGTTHRVIEASFKLTKTMHCHDSKNVDEMVNKLDRLKNEDFNRVHIPDFEYKVDGNILTYDTVFIKGWGVGTLIPYFTNIIYEDIVQRDLDWTFDDYGSSNFIVEHNTDRIFAVDFQSYNYLPNRDYRESKWKKFEKLNSNVLDGLSKGEWINPAHHPIRQCQN